MQAIIIAGGKGERIQELGKEIPKLLLPLNNIPLIDHIIKTIKRNNVKEIIICTGHLSDKIKEYLEKKDYGIKIKISKEEKPLGTAGPLNIIKNSIKEDFFILYGDLYMDINLNNILKFHKQKNADATLVLHKSDHPWDSTIVTINDDNKINGFFEKPGKEFWKYNNLTNAALYLVKKDIINFIEEEKKLDLAKDIFPLMLKSNKKLYGYITEEYIKDIGTPERYIEVEKKIRSENEENSSIHR